MWGQDKFMKSSVITNMISSLVFWGIVLAAAGTFLSSLVFFLSPDSAGTLFQGVSIGEDYAYGHWGSMIVAILIFSYFVVSFSHPMKRREWRNLGMYEAFLVALFAEMYGFPLTIYLLTSVFGVSLSFGHTEGHLLAVFLSKIGLMELNRAWALVMALSTFLLLIGFILVRKGWRGIYHSTGELVTDGIYAKIRHPQYLGFLVITIAFLIQWPTILTIAIWPVLLVMYYRLAKREERTLFEIFGDVYSDYQSRVPMFIPSLHYNIKPREDEPWL
jgi:protein-S-isoprenylcysteine O-methyltransferase Ste14